MLIIGLKSLLNGISKIILIEVYGFHTKYIIN